MKKRLVLSMLFLLGLLPGKSPGSAFDGFCEEPCADVCPDEPAAGENTGSAGS